MSEEKTPATEPQSPSVVKSATGTTAKPKRKPALETNPETHKERSTVPVAFPETHDPESPEREVPIKSGKSGKSFLDDAFEVFGWNG